MCSHSERSSPHREHRRLAVPPMLMPIRLWARATGQVWLYLVPDRVSWQPKVSRTQVPA